MDRKLKQFDKKNFPKDCFKNSIDFGGVMIYIFILNLITWILTLTLLNFEIYEEIET